MGVDGQCHTLDALPLVKTWNPSYRRLGGAQSQSGWVRKISPPPGFDPWTIQPVDQTTYKPQISSDSNTLIRMTTMNISRLALKITSLPVQ